jgi:hypothetical protein
MVRGCLTGLATVGEGAGDDRGFRSDTLLVAGRCVGP